MQCDMCGQEKKLYRTKIEGAFLNVCNNCSEHGEVFEEVRELKPENQAKIHTREINNQKEIIQIIRKDYSEVVKNAREKTGLKQKELASKIAEKESVIHKVESGSYKPNINLARKLEKFLNIELVEQHVESHDNKYTKTESETFTLGDMMKVRKR